MTICITEKPSTLQMAFQTAFFLSLLLTGFLNALGISKLKLQFCPMLYSHDKISAADFVVEVQNPICILSLLTLFQVLEKKFPCISRGTKSHFVSHLFCFLKCFLWCRGFQTILKLLQKEKETRKSKDSFHCIMIIKLWVSFIFACKGPCLCWGWCKWVSDILFYFSEMATAFFLDHKKKYQSIGKWDGVQV